MVGDVSVEDDARAMIEAAVSAYGRHRRAGRQRRRDPAQHHRPDVGRRLGPRDGGRRPRHVPDLQVRHRAHEPARARARSCCCRRSPGQRGQVGQAAYGPAKYVATGLTHHLAVEWAARGIRVNAVAPGTIRTDAVVSRPGDRPRGRRTSRRSRAGTRSAASASRARWPRRSPSWPPTPPRSSPAPCCRSTAGTSPSRPARTALSPPAPGRGPACSPGGTGPTSTTTATSARPIGDREVSPVAEVPGQAELDQLGQHHRAAGPGRTPGQLPGAEDQQRRRTPRRTPPWSRPW